MWSNGKSLDSSIRSKDNKILIMIDYGLILNPVEPNMSYKQKKTIKKLIRPIVEKDSKYLLDNLLKDDIL